MSHKAVLLDLENNMPSATVLKNIVEHYPTLYLFNCQGQFEYSLEHLTEFASWVSSGQVVILETPKAKHKEFEYAVVVGQLMALLEPNTQVEVLSAVENCEILLQLMKSSGINCNLTQIQTDIVQEKTKNRIPSIQVIKENSALLLVKKYCDALTKMSGKPTTLESLKNSLTNILQIEAEQMQHILGMLINLKIVKRVDTQIHFRKKVLKQWALLDLHAECPQEQEMGDVHLKLLQNQDKPQMENIYQVAQQNLFKDFAQIDPVQLEVARKLREMKEDRPKDIYALRDLLEQLFPKSDVRLLLKELIEKGYIYWNGYEVLYSHEMFLN